MEETSSGELATVSSTQLGTTNLALQISSFFAQNPVSSSTTMASSPATSLSSAALAQDFVRTIDSLAPLSSTGTASGTTFSTQQTTPSSSDNQPLQSPSPSDTLAPLLLSNLQLPSGASIAHDHPHPTTFQSSSTASVVTTSAQGGASNSVPSNMLTPTTVGSLSIAASNATSSVEDESTQTPESSAAIDPTFLAALPLSIRQEVLAQHRREQRVSQPADEQQEVEAPFQSSISPEFLSALPPNIQTEVGCFIIE